MFSLWKYAWSFEYMVRGLRIDAICGWRHSARLALYHNTTTVNWIQVWDMRLRIRNSAGRPVLRYNCTVTERWTCRFTFPDHVFKWPWIQLCISENWTSRRRVRNLTSQTCIQLTVEICIFIIFKLKYLCPKRKHEP